MKFNEFLNEITPMDELPNNNLLTEAGLSRLLSQIKDNDFAIITAFRKEFIKEENITRSRKLRAEFNSNNMSVYQLIGHWKEDNVDIIEKLYLVVRPDNTEINEFKNLIVSLTQKFNQSATILATMGSINIVDESGRILDTKLKITLEKVKQAYTQYIKKQKTPFTLECEIPGSNSGRMMMGVENILYPVCEADDVRTWDTIVNDKIDLVMLSEFLNNASEEQMAQYRTFIDNKEPLKLKGLIENVHNRSII